MLHRRLTTVAPLAATKDTAVVGPSVITTVVEAMEVTKAPLGETMDPLEETMDPLEEIMEVVEEYLPLMDHHLNPMVPLLNLTDLLPNHKEDGRRS